MSLTLLSLNSNFLPGFTVTMVVLDPLMKVWEKYMSFSSFNGLSFIESSRVAAGNLDIVLPYSDNSFNIDIV